MNIQLFPKQDNQTIENVNEIISDLKIDLYAIQEITDVNEFNNLVNSLSEYSGRVGTGSASFALWPAIIYKTSIFTIKSEKYIFTNDYDFPRAPYLVELEYSNNNEFFDFTLIVLHLKAQGDPDDISRRKNAIIKLESYVNDNIQQAKDPDYIIIGDWNDELDDVTNNVFLPFISKQPQAYLFLTWPFRGSISEYSYIGGNFRSLIDHLLITDSIESKYPQTTQIIKIDQLFTQYLNEVSDHRPIASRFSGF